MLPEEFTTAFSASERQRIDALDRATAWIG